MADAFHLETSASGLAALTFDLPDSRVNLFTREALEELRDVLADLPARQDIGCLVLLSGKDSSFCHGVQVDLLTHLESASQGTAGSQAGQALFSSWARLPFPTVAAIRSTCVGGGTELAVASTFRVLSDRKDLRIGLPEVRLGILPAWGGCVRLPRLIGLPNALELILSGKSIPSYKALKMGLADALVPDSGFLHHVRDFALDKVQQRSELPGDQDPRESLLTRNPLGRRLIFDQARRRILDKSRDTYPAPLRAVEVIRMGIEDGPEVGFAAEARALGELATGKVSQNLLHVFQLHQGAKKSNPTTPEVAQIQRTAVVGAGLMGSAIAHSIATKAQLPVDLLDRNQDALEAALESSATLIYNRTKRRRMTPPQGRQAMAMLRPVLELEQLSQVDLLVEAVSEDLAVKEQLLVGAAQQLAADSILATNTSSLTVSSVAENIPHPDRVVGLHFFNPVNRVPLVEVVAGKETSERTVLRAANFVRSLGKTPMKVGDCPGFIVNRLLIFTMVEALWLLADDFAIEAVDEAITKWGLPIGPFALIDRVGIDIAFAVAQRLSEAYGDRLKLPPWNPEEIFFARDLLGAKQGGGFYRYQGQRPKGVETNIYSWLGLPSGKRLADPVVTLDRLLLPMVNEAARCLQEGIVETPHQIDLAMVLGAGFPPFRGGLCRWADAQGLATILRQLERLSDSLGERFAPSEALREIDQRGGFYG
ncbi:MAG: enoyl-CoA hydratase/isomerase family protein [Deltaproteobacteria bacterium]|nr:enoyl-CoA hydratase/isomerase family protein [Deltaproteobacteria bacterium]